MKKQVYNLENIQERYGTYQQWGHTRYKLTYQDIKDLGWTIVDHKTTYTGKGDGIGGGYYYTAYVLAEPKVEQWLKDNNIKIRKSSVWFDEATA